MPLSREEVEHIAELARLSLTEQEKERLQEELSEILDTAQRLERIDTSDIPPTATVLPVDTVLRPDESRPGPPRDRLLKNAAEQEDGQYRVDVILD